MDVIERVPGDTWRPRGRSIVDANGSGLHRMVAIFRDFSGVWTNLDALIFIGRWTIDRQEPRSTHDRGSIVARSWFNRGTIVVPWRRNQGHDRWNLVGIHSTSRPHQTVTKIGRNFPLKRRCIFFLFLNF